MKVIVLTDTHGQIDRINQLAIENNADACIHCGDVGFFDHISIKNMSAAELTKMIRRAPVTKETIEHVCSLPQRVQADFVSDTSFVISERDFLILSKSFSKGITRSMALPIKVRIPKRTSIPGKNAVTSIMTAPQPKT